MLVKKTQGIICPHYFIPVKENAGASTQNQALTALLFLYREQMSIPKTGQRMNLEAPISSDLMTVLELLRGA